MVPQVAGSPHPFGSASSSSASDNSERGIFDAATVPAQGHWSSAVTSDDHRGRECCLFAVAFVRGSGPDREPEADGLSGRMPPMNCTFMYYFVLCCLVVGGVSFLAVGLWSGMGFGERCLRVLVDGVAYRPLALGACVLLLTTLYLLDFFWPPHLPKQALALWDGDQCSRRWLLGIVAALLAVAGLLSAEEDLSWPLLITIALCPCLMAAVLSTLQRPRTVAEILAKKIALHGDVRAKAELLQVLVQREEDQLRFLWAALSAFSLSSVVVFVAWLLWALDGGTGLCSLCDDDHRHDRMNAEDLAYLLWSTPLVVAVSNAVFGLFIALRLAAQRSYEATDSCKAQLLADQAAVESGTTSAEALESARRLGIERRERLSRQLSLLMKMVSMVFIFLLGVLYIVGQLLYAESIVSSMIGGVLGLYLLVFVAFIYLAFRRIVFALGQWIVSQPLWRLTRVVQQSNWTRAFIVYITLPFLPLVLGISALNQCVRRCRRLSPSSPVKASDGIRCSSIVTNSVESDEPESPVFWPSSHSWASSGPQSQRPEKLFLTPRVHEAVKSARTWDWLAVLLRCYIYCGGYLCYTICPLMLNVSLSWLGGALAGWPFWVVVAATFVIGIVAFLLPPVPGLTVYIFGGLMISQAAEAGGYGGFWGGSFINIAACWLLKLVACAIQQKCIGELLGQSLWVRKTVGVHKPHIRCIEAILREPGMSLGKVAILCGGPDWPTSVLAGILRLSLAQCELGTTPIIFFVAPCALTGSFYLKRGVSEVWKRSAKLMVILSVAVNLLLWAIAAWAIQRQLERHHQELTKPRPENVDLEWMEYRVLQLEKATSVSWGSTPAAVRWALAYCVGLQIFICQAFFWAFSLLFGDFQVEDNIDDLDWFSTGKPGRKYLFSAMAAPLALGVFVIAWVGPWCFLRWRRSATHDARLEAALVLDAEESAWKKSWLQDAWNDPEVVTGSAFNSKASASPLTASTLLPSTPQHMTPGETNAPSAKEEESRGGRDSSTPPSDEEQPAGITR